MWLHCIVPLPVEVSGDEALFALADDIVCSHTWIFLDDEDNTRDCDDDSEEDKVDAAILIAYSLFVAKIFTPSRQNGLNEIVGSE